MKYMTFWVLFEGTRKKVQDSVAPFSRSPFLNTKKCPFLVEEPGGIGECSTKFVFFCFGKYQYSLRKPFWGGAVTIFGENETPHAKNEYLFWA